MKREEKEKIKDLLMQLAEIRITPESTIIRGDKASILALIACLTHQLIYKCDGNFSKEEVLEAVEEGFEKMPSDKKDIEDFDFDKATDKLQGMLDELKNLIKKED